MIAATRRTLHSIVLFGSLAASPALALECLQFGDTVTLSGSYALGVLPAPDGILRDVRVDAGRKADLLTLTVPICVTADVVSIGVPETITVQVHCPALQEEGGGILSITGRLFGAHMRNGHTPVVLTCAR